MRPMYVASPHSMADAMATLTDPARHGCLPSVIQTNWLFLKEARGQRCRIERLAITHHMITRPVARPAPDDSIDVTMPDGRRISIPVTTSLAHVPQPTTGCGGTVDAIDAARLGVLPRIWDKMRALSSDHDPKGAA